uniref:Uncharacterized protein n=1 Tax=Arundo donax TaxID=35708 RepID=A0A0A9HPS7_ARUDO
MNGLLCVIPSFSKTMGTAMIASVGCPATRWTSTVEFCGIMVFSSAYSSPVRGSQRAMSSRGPRLGA